MHASAYNLATTPGWVQSDDRGRARTRVSTVYLIPLPPLCVSGNSSDGATAQNGTHANCNGGDKVLDENKLAQILVQALLPSFAKEIHLKALIAYQIDGECNHSLIVNRCFRRVDPNQEDEARVPTVTVGTATASSPLNDSGVECGGDANPSTPASIKQEENSNTSSTSRRKRKLCRPSKIPQSPVHKPESPQLCKVQKVEPPTPVTQVLQPTDAIAPTLVSALFSAAQLEPKHQVPILPNPLASVVLTTAATAMPVTTTTTKLILPVPTVTTLNGTQPRPILPRPIQASNSAPVMPLAPLPLVPLQPLQADSTDNQDAESDDSLAAKRSPKAFICNQCKLSFPSLNALCEHTYSQHKAFRCNFCGAQFTQRSNLQRHSLRHVGFKPFVCGVCQKEYYRKDHLVRHIEVTHPGTDSKKNIITKLTSAECLDYLDAITQQHNQQQQQLQHNLGETAIANDQQIVAAAASTEVVVPVEASPTTMSAV